MTDRQIRFLRLVTERLQRQLELHDSGDPPAIGSRQRLEQSVQRARARLQQAEARRSQRRPRQAS